MNLKKLFNLNRLSEACGLRVNSEVDNSELLIKQRVERDTKGAVPLADYLSYRYFDEDDCLFILDGGIVGFLIEIAPIVGSDDKLEKNLNLFFNSELPEGVHLQFLLIASHDIDEKIAIWKADRGKNKNEMLERLTKYRESFLRERAKDFSNCDGRMGRDFRIYVSYSAKIGDDQKKLELTRKFRLKLIKKFEAIKLSPRARSAEDLIKIAGDLMQMQLKSKPRKQYDHINCLSKQILDPMQAMIIEDEAIVHDSSGLVSKCFYPSALPERHSLLEMIELLGSRENEGSIPARFVISYSLATDLNKTAEANIIARGYRAIHAAEQFYARHDTNLKAEVGEWREIIARHKNGERFLTESMAVMITSTKSEIESAEEKIKSLYNSRDWQLTINKNLQLPALLSMLPMQQASYWQILKHFQLVKTVQSMEVVAKLPIHGEWKGVNRSGVMLLGRRGELFNWNPFVRIGGGGNYNICVMAPPGGGKSFLLQELTTSMLCQDVAVFILDIGASYQNICESVGGESVRFNSKNEISLNPFATLAGSGAVYIKASELLMSNYPVSEVSRITGLLEEQIEALRLGSGENAEAVDPNDKIEILQLGSHFVTKDSVIYANSIISVMCDIKGDAHKEAILAEAITKGVTKYGSSLDITKLSNELRGQDNLEAIKLGETLIPYTDSGMHGRFFKSGNPASFKQMLTLLEFEEVKDSPSLLAVILQVILMQITMQFLCGDRSRRFMLIVDEAWLILDFSASFLEAFARTVRKYGGCLVTCVQDFNSFQKTPSHRAIYECSTWTVILQTGDKGLKAFANSTEFEGHLPLIRSIKKDAENKYSEVLIQCEGLKIVGRLVVDPYSMALYSTEAEDYNFLSRCKAEGMSKDEAIKLLSKKYGTLPDIGEEQNRTERKTNAEQAA